MELSLAWEKLPGGMLKRWPKDSQGEYVAPVFLTHLQSTDMADMLTLNMLEAYGIPAMRVYPGDGAFASVVMGLSGTGSDIFVPVTDYEYAKALMEAEIDEEL